MNAIQALYQLSYSPKRDNENNYSKRKKGMQPENAGGSQYGGKGALRADFSQIVANRKNFLGGKACSAAMPHAKPHVPILGFALHAMHDDAADERKLIPPATPNPWAQSTHTLRSLREAKPLRAHITLAAR